MNTDISRYFTISGAVTQDRRRQFAGREVLLSKCLDSLSVGSSVVIFGERGVGKTSLGWQVLGPCAGNREILEERNIYTTLPPREFYCIWLTCVQFMRNAADVIFSLLRSPDRRYSLRSHFPKVFQRKDLIERLTQKYSVSLFGARGEVTIEPSMPASLSDEIDVANPNLVAFQVLRDVLELARDQYREKPTLIFIDEFDRVQDRVEIGSLIKALNDVQFVIIGVANSRNALIGDHPSIVRKLSAIGVPLLNREESDWFFDSVERESKSLSFARNFRGIVFQKSSGFPWLVQQLGYYAALEAARGRPGEAAIEVKKSHYEAMVGEFLRQKLGEELPLLDLSRVEKIVLWSLVDTQNGRMPSADLIKSLPIDLRPYFEDALVKLKTIGILDEQGAEVRLRDPLTKVLLERGKEESIL